MDDVDLAQQNSNRLLAATIAQRHAAAGGTGVTEAVDCRVCGNPIPAARQKVLNGTLLCVACQDQLERRQRR